MESKKNLKKYDVMAFVVILLNVFIFLNNEKKVSELLMSFKSASFSIPTLLLILIDFLTIIYVIFSFIIKIKYKLSYGYKNINIKYARDDLKKINPSYLYYLLNMDIDVDKCMNATLLKLTCDEYLKIENDTFIYTKKDIENLSNSEKILILSIKKECEDTKEKFYERYRYLILKEVEKEGYIKERKTPFLIYIQKFISLFLLLSLFCIIIIVNFFSEEKAINVFGSFILIFIFGVVVTICMIEFFVDKKNIGFDFNYNKTKQAKKIIEEMLGLKAFLKDFSIIEDRTLEELELQQYYFIYSIIFELNDDENKKIEEIKNNSLCFKER